MARVLSSHAGHFFSCVFVDFDSNKIFYKVLIFSRSYTDSNKIFYKSVFFSRSYTISIIYTLMVEKHTLRKTAYLPNRTCVGASLMYQIKAWIHPSHFWTRCQTSSMRSTWKTPQKRTLKYHSVIYWSTWKTYEFSRHRCCVALNFRDNVNHLLSHRFKPLMEPRIP